MVLARALVASHNQKLDLWCNVAGLAVNVVLNWLLIPRFGPNGAAVATVGSIVFFLLFLWLAVNRTLFRASLWPAFSRPVPAAVGMTALAWWLGDAPLIVVIPLCALAYGGLLLLLRSFSAEETEVLRALFGGRFSRNALSAR
jgi:O-antigen/teichoic acid export membrane protein